nr:hypothetical protein [Tanacetum cinerariifolium]
MSLKIDVKGVSSYVSRITVVAPTHSAFIGAASTNTKMVYSDQPSYSSLITYTFAPSSSIIEDVLHSFVAENEPTQKLAYEDFEQADQLKKEELDIKWQMAMLSLRINKFQKKAGRKINFNNMDSARFDRRKVRWYNCLQLGYFARECNVKKVDEKARYSDFKILEVKIDEPKAMVSVDSIVNWNEHEAENKTEEAEQCKSHLIKDFDVYDTVDNFPPVVSKAAYVPAGSQNSSASTSAGRYIPAGSRNRPTFIHVGRFIPAASRNRPASIHADRCIPTASRNRPASIYAGRINKLAPFPAGRSVPTGWTNPATRPFFRPTNLYFDNVYWPSIYDHMSINEGRWGSAVKSSASCSWRNNRPYMQWGSKNNGGSHQSTWFRT